MSQQKRKIDDLLADLSDDERDRVLRELRRPALNRRYTEGMEVYVSLQEPPAQFSPEKLLVWGVQRGGHLLCLTDTQPDDPKYPKKNPGRKRKEAFEQGSDSSESDA